MPVLLASDSAPADAVLISDPTGVLAVLLAVLVVIFAAAQHPALATFFRYVPTLLFCYFIPSGLSAAGVIPRDSALYEWVKDTLLPASLLLLILALDVPAILRLGPKAVIMMLAGTAGVVIGGPLALLATQAWLPEDAWRGMSALAGSWIGGGANMIAMKQIAGASDALFGVMVVVDVFNANLWMAVLLYFASTKDALDRILRADTSAIVDLQQRVTAYQEATRRMPSLFDYLLMMVLAFGGSWLAIELSRRLPSIGDFITGIGWKYIAITTLGVVLSFTPARRLDGAGASRVGSLFIYVLIACIGAHADFRGVIEFPAFILMGTIWILIHAAIMLTVGWFIRAPIFFVAVGSQANIGGAASAPIVASAFHPSLAAVGALLAVAGYVLGTYAAVVCMHMLRWVAGQ